MSIPRRSMSSVGSRTKEPEGTSAETYASLFHKYLPADLFKAAEDGQGIFIRDAVSTRDNIDRCYLALDQITNITWFPKKTTMLEAMRNLYMNSKGQHSKLWTNVPVAAADRIDRLRAESYAVKKMFLEIANCSKHMKTGEKLNPGLKALATKFLKNHKGNFAASVKLSPFAQRYQQSFIVFVHHFINKVIFALLFL